MIQLFETQLLLEGLHPNPAAMAGRLQRVLARARRAWQINAAFTWLGYTEELAYPLNFVLKQLQPIFTVIVYYFLSLLVDSGSNVAGDYYSFVVVGAVVIRMLDSGLGAFSSTLEATVTQGRLESLLVELRDLGTHLAVVVDEYVGTAGIRTLEQLVAIAHESAPVSISADARARVDAARRVVEEFADRDEPTYGINTGFGNFADVKIPRAITSRSIFANQSST